MGNYLLGTNGILQSGWRKEHYRNNSDTSRRHTLQCLTMATIQPVHPLDEEMETRIAKAT